MADPIDTLVDYFRNDRGWHFHDGNTAWVGRHKGFFVRRRAESHSVAHPEWLAEGDLHSMKGRIGLELDAVEAYLITKLGTGSNPAKRGPLYGGAGDLAPPHLDLADLAQRRITEISTTLAAALATKSRKVMPQRVFDNVEARSHFVITIVWRATAIQDEVWKPPLEGPVADLEIAQLDFLLDRRLHMVERMRLNVADHQHWGGDPDLKGGNPDLALTGPHGPWNDGWRVRPFEYPKVPNTEPYRTAIGNNLEGAPGATPPYEWSTSLDQQWLTYQVGPWAHARFPKDIDGNFQKLPDVPSTPLSFLGYHRLRLVPAATTPAAVFDSIFTNPIDGATGKERWTDRWNRCWLYCDHVLSALHFEALLFAIRRRDGDESKFNAIVTTHPNGYLGLPGYIALDALVGTGVAVDMSELGADATDTQFFFNGPVPERDIQVGDHLIFWNSFVYQFVNSSEWRLENSLVMDVDSDPKSGGHRRRNLKLQGHGTTTRLYSNYTEGIAAEFKSSLKLARKALGDFLAANPGSIAFAWPDQDKRLLKWSPYEEFDPPGAWWVRLPVSPNWKSAADAVAAIGKAVMDRTVRGTGYNPPPELNAVYFPLFEPKDLGGWETYLTNRASDVGYRSKYTALEPTKVDGSIIPGLYPKGEVQTRNQIAMVRPLPIA